LTLKISSRVARWYAFKPKILIWVNLGGPWNEKVGKFYGHLVYFNGRLVVLEAI
jgi:hypothetical protein